MLSVLIPVYNYNLTKLVSDIHKQLVDLTIDFEIICIDDVSNKSIIETNQEIINLTFTSYLLSDKNNGIAVTRQLLTDKAKYRWILLLDADVEIDNDNFILNYLNALSSGNDFIFGGFAYKKQRPHDNYLLRWKYGKHYEALSAEKRNKNPYKITIAANVLVKKVAYRSFNLNSIGKQYAMDYYFGALLSENHSKVLHIDNQVYHLGIEKSIDYLKKKERATETLLKLHQEKKIIVHSNDLLSTFVLFKKTGLNYVLVILFKILRPILRKNLIGSNPIIPLLQFYKIGYICHLDWSNKA